ncbi:MBOAT, membrane-bound O-acyltransferase family-domain-containing protein [Limtongia smithiae]|uniref:MBOAT, membrane-bound O-acyltransferase family-domain-containing protein n=1 Tax=Limtongia smithiae TaxID=1125753 RepID=UPI0034CDEB0E
MISQATTTAQQPQPRSPSRTSSGAGVHKRRSTSKGSHRAKSPSPAVIASTTLDVENTTAGAQEDTLEVAEISPEQAAPAPSLPKFSHIYPIHHVIKGSILSRDSTAPTPSFVGFRNLAMIVLVVSNLRLVIENYTKYGVLIGFSGLGSRSDILLTLFLTAAVPLHLFIALSIEKLIAIPTINYISQIKLRAPQNGKKSSTRSRRTHSMGAMFPRPKPKHMWRLVVFLHSVNSLACLVYTTIAVYTCMRNPMLGTICMIHSIIVCLKVASYALTNRDLRELLLLSEPVPWMYRDAPYPQNLTLGNLTYFWWAPTLVYQPMYPRSPKFRVSFFAQRALEIFVSSVLVWFLSVQYAVPTLENSLAHMHNLEIVGIVERLLKLATISMAVWLIGFFCIFHSLLNALAEVMRFGDREFYDDWWNSRSVGEYWRLWNKPVTNYFRRHIYVPLVRRGWRPTTSSVMVFFVSAALHEVAVGVPTHNVIFVAFTLMLLQIPLIQATAPLERLRKPWAAAFGNCIFWFSFFIGQPSAVLIYFFAWSLRHSEGAEAPTFTVDDTAPAAPIPE